MPHEWSPERVIDAALAAQVIREQFPELADLPVRAFDAGWDNVVHAVGQDWLFRFIHREIALPGARRELAVLLHLADRFAVPIPCPVFIGRPAPPVDWPFWGTRALPGRELALAALPDGDRVPVAEALGTFLRDLHRPTLAAGLTAAGPAGVELPIDPLGRADGATVAGRARTSLATLTENGLWHPDDATAAVLDRAAALGPADPADAVLVHGDLHVRHVLIDDGRASGVIDWGDTALADPSVDLMIAYAAFTPDVREHFLAAYGAVPAEREVRARALAVRVHALLAWYSSVEGLDAVHREATAALHRAVV